MAVSKGDLKNINDFNREVKIFETTSIYIWDGPPYQIPNHNQ